MPVKFAGIELRGPFLPASGCYGYGWEAEESLGPLRWGAVVTKTVTPLPREGNPPPRIQETESGIVNRIGLQNCGLDEFISLHAARLKKLSCPFIVSIFSESEEGWITLSGKLSQAGAAALELNLSCPNLSGERMTSDPAGCAGVVELVKKHSGIPVIPKINALDRPVFLGRALERSGADAIVCSNTLPALFHKNGEFHQGGLSGPAIKPVALRAVRDLCRSVSIDVGACGGISTAEDAEEYRLAGAKVFILGSVLLKHPGIVNSLQAGLTD